MKMDLKALISKLTNTPMVVEQGTSGTNPAWTYRKWSNGTAECWGYATETSLAMTSQEGYAYYAPLKTYSYPTSLFTSSPSVQVSTECNGRLVSPTINVGGSAQVQIYYSCSTSQTKTVYGHIYAIGKWK